MKKYLISGLLITVLAVSVSAVLAQKPDFRPVNVNPSGGQAMVVIPAHAVELAPGVFFLGTAMDNGKLVEGYAYIDYRKGYGKPPWAGGGKNGGGDTACYGFLSKGAKWKAAEPYVVDSGMDAVLVAKDLETWDAQVTFDIFGSQDLGSTVDGADTVSPDDKNEVMWGNIADSNAIAVAIVWGIFSGNPSWREIVEYDVVFDTDYVWGDAEVDLSVMDFENIATHEFGHAAGLADLYETSCAEQTMYGYANNGEWNKRSLEVGDKAGIKELYK